MWIQWNILSRLCNACRIKPMFSCFWQMQIFWSIWFNKSTFSGLEVANLEVLMVASGYSTLNSSQTSVIFIVKCYLGIVSSVYCFLQLFIFLSAWQDISSLIKNLIIDDLVSSGSAVGPPLGLWLTEYVVNCKDSFFTTTVLLQGEFGKADYAFIIVLLSEHVDLCTRQSLESDFFETFCLLLCFLILPFCWTNSIFAFFSPPFQFFFFCCCLFSIIL